MANEFNFRAQSGSTCYVHILDKTGKVWDGANFVQPVTANWAAYSIAATEEDTTGYFHADWDPVIGTPDTDFEIIPFKQNGGAPATTDQLIGSMTYKCVQGMEKPFGEHFFEQSSDTAGLLAGQTTIDGHLDTQDTAIAALPVDVWTFEIESGLTPGPNLVNDSATQLAAITAQQVLALNVSALAGKLSGAEVGSVLVTINGIDGLASRIVATIDADDNRTNIVATVPDGV